VIVADPAEAGACASSGDGVGWSGAPDSPRSESPAFDQTHTPVEGITAVDCSLAPAPCGRCGNRDFRRRSRVPAQQQRSLTAVAAAPMPRCGRANSPRRRSATRSLRDLELLDRNHAVAAGGKSHRSSLRFAASPPPASWAGAPAALNALDAEALEASPQCVAVYRHPVHGDAVEGRFDRASA